MNALSSSGGTNHLLDTSQDESLPVLARHTMPEEHAVGMRADAMGQIICDLSGHIFERYIKYVFVYTSRSQGKG